VPAAIDLLDFLGAEKMEMGLGSPGASLLMVTAWFTHMRYIWGCAIRRLISLYDFRRLRSENVDRRKSS